MTNNETEPMPQGIRLHGKEIEEGMIRVQRFGKAVKPERQVQASTFSLENSESKKKLAEKVHKILAKLQPATNRLNLPEDERLSPGEVLRQNLLGIVDDGTPIIAIIPEEEANANHLIAKTDPLWEHVVPLLTEFENHRVFVTFIALNKFYYHVHSDKAKEQIRINILMRKYLRREESLKSDDPPTFETVGDLRKLNALGWSSIPRIGDTLAKIMPGAFEKIEITAE